MVHAEARGYRNGYTDCHTLSDLSADSIPFSDSNSYGIRESNGHERANGKPYAPRNGNAEQHTDEYAIARANRDADCNAYRHAHTDAAVAVHLYDDHRRGRDE